MNCTFISECLSHMINVTNVLLINVLEIVLNLKYLFAVHALDFKKCFSVMNKHILCFHPTVMKTLFWNILYTLKTSSFLCIKNVFVGFLRTLQEYSILTF